MRVAVIQYRTQNDKKSDSARVGEMVSAAIDSGADVVVAPVGAEGDHRGAPGAMMLGGSPVARSLWRDVSAFGDTAQLLGDTCFDPDVMRTLSKEPPDALILHPGSESDLQAEALLEYAIGLSLSVSSLVIVSECVPEIGSGVGWSAIVSLGEILAEGESATDTLFAEVDVPVAAPDPREELPTPAAILSNRLSVHRGDRPDVGYLAELS